jgi:glucoamylase
VKLVRSLKDGRVFDQAPQTVKRYRIEKREPVYWAWRFNNKCRTIPAGKTLRLVLLAPAMVHWSSDGWKTAHDQSTRDTGLGIYVTDLPTSPMKAGETMVFTFFWTKTHNWENANFSVTIEDR